MSWTEISKIERTLAQIKKVQQAFSLWQEEVGTTTTPESTDKRCEASISNQNSKQEGSGGGLLGSRQHKLQVEG